jgi:hypothetical protein
MVLRGIHDRVTEEVTWEVGFLMRKPFDLSSMASHRTVERNSRQQVEVNCCSTATFKAPLVQ